MQWGLHHSEGWTIYQSSPTTVHLVPVLLEPKLLQQVQDATAVHGVTVAARRCGGSPSLISPPVGARARRPADRMTRATTASASCYGWMRPRPGRCSTSWSISIGHGRRSFASSSRKHSLRIFPRAGGSPHRSVDRRAVLSPSLMKSRTVSARVAGMDVPHVNRRTKCVGSSMKTVCP
jgi:hypothetical protein